MYDFQSVSQFLALLFTFLGLGVLGTVIQTGSGDEDRAPLPRAKRRRRGPKEDLGLPPDDELWKLAKFYLTYAAKLWPDLVKAGLIARPNDPVLRAMVAGFKDRHRTGKVDPAKLRPFSKLVEKLGAAYPRYSDVNSDAKSIVDQLRQQLDKAKSESRFIPWEYVRADYARSATQGFRQGYEGLLKLIKHKGHDVDTVYIDEFMRASRDEEEWWKLAGVCKKLGIRMVGASDGFHLDDEDWDTKVGFYNLVAKMEGKYKRLRVRRGMRGAAIENRSLGKLPLGYTRRPRVDSHGNVERKSNGDSVCERCFCPDTRKFAELLWELFYVKKWTAYKIAKKFNRDRAEDWDGWTESGIKTLLVNPAFIGLFIWNRTRTEYDYETKTWGKVLNHWTQWEIYYDSELALVPKSWHVYARNKLVKNRRKRADGDKPKPQRAAATLFSDTLNCKDCEWVLTLLRSTDKYKSMYCQNGATGKHGCTLSSSKSTRIIEESLLGFIREHLLTKKHVKMLVTKANKFLKEEANKPSIDTRPLKARERRLTRDIEHLLGRVAKTTDDALCEAYDKEIAKLQRSLNEVRGELTAANRYNVPVPKPLDVSQIETYLEDMRAVLNQEVPAAAEAIRALTGPIMVHQEAIPGRKTGAKWIATFTPDFMRLLAHVAGSRPHYPVSSTLEFLCSANWIKLKTVVVDIHKVPEFERLAPEIQKLCDSGMSISAIASAYGKTWKCIKEILVFADTGVHPEWKAGKRTGKGGSQIYKEISRDVLRLRDQEQYSWRRIRHWLATERPVSVKVGVATIRRAYDYGHRDVICEDVKAGKKPDRGGYSHIDVAKKQQARELLEAGRSDKEVATKVGVSVSTIRRLRREMQDE